MKDNPNLHPAKLPKVSIWQTRCKDCDYLKKPQAMLHSKDWKGHIEARCDSHNEVYYEGETVQFDFARDCQDFKEKGKK